MFALQIAGFRRAPAQIKGIKNDGLIRLCGLVDASCEDPRPHAWSMCASCSVLYFTCNPSRAVSEVPTELPTHTCGVMCCGTEAGSYLRLIDSCITQLKAQGPSRTCNESKEEEEEANFSSVRAAAASVKVLLYPEPGATKLYTLHPPPSTLPYNLHPTP